MPKLFVGNLSFKAGESDIEELFAEAGYPTKSVKIIVDKDTGRSKGFGFVELQDDAASGEAIGSLNQMPLKGRNMNVSEATSRAPSGGASKSEFRRR